MANEIRPLPSEIRYVEGVQLRAAADGRYLDTVVTRYALWRDVGPFEEYFEPGVFTATLSRHSDSIKLVVGHDDSVPAVATPVEWRNTDTELAAVYRFGTHAEAQRAAQMADEGMFGGVSVGFLPSRKSGHNVWTKSASGYPQVRRVQARLLHVGLVTTPADADAQIREVRSVGVPDDVVLATPNLDEARRILAASDAKPARVALPFRPATGLVVLRPTIGGRHDTPQDRPEPRDTSVALRVRTLLPRTEPHVCSCALGGAHIMAVADTIERLQSERVEQEDFIEQLVGGVEGRDLVDAEKANVHTAEKRIAELDDQLGPLLAFEKRRASAAKIPATLTRFGGTPAPTAETRSLGQIYTESPEFNAYQGRGASVPITIPEFRAVGPDPLLTNTVPGSVLLGTNKERIQTPGHFVTFPLLSIVGRIETSQNSVELIVTGDASGADVVLEGAQKPAVVWTATDSSVTLATVAGWFKHSRQAQRDISNLRDLIDQKIRRAIDVKLNALATTALGTAFTGGNTTTGAAGVPLIELIRGALASLEVRGISTAGAVVLVNPADAAAIDIAMMKSTSASGSGMVLYGQYWGLPVIPVNGVAAGSAIVGDVNEALAWIYKGGLSMFTTDSDVTDGSPVKSDFRANILTTLGEVFGVFAVTDASVVQKVVATP